MGKRSRFTLPIVLSVALLAMLASYGSTAVTEHLVTSTGGEVYVPFAQPSAPTLQNALVIPERSPTVPLVGPSAVSALDAKLGPGLPPGALAPSNSTDSELPLPGCATDCPMGITDYGLNATEASKSYRFTFAESYFDSGTSLSIGRANGGGCLDKDAEHRVCFTLQQNAIVQDIYGGGGYYWTQDAAEIAYDSSCSAPCVSGTYSVTFLDNVWNFSDSGGICPSDLKTGPGCINPSRIVGNGESDCRSHGGTPTLYDCVSSTVYNITLPFTITAATNVNYNGCTSGENCVYFYGAVQEGPTIVTGGYFDEVTFHMHDGSKDPFYQVKYVNSPVGLPEDYEWILGGPGGGSGNTIESYGDLQSFYCDSGAKCDLQTNWHSIQDAWSSGADTGEYVFDVYVTPEFNYRDQAGLYVGPDDPQTYVF
jgi:hypothetical protein